MPKDCATVQYETITLEVAYFADGTVHYCNPNTGEVLFKKKFDKCPLVKIEKYITDSQQ